MTEQKKEQKERPRGVPRGRKLFVFKHFLTLNYSSEV